MNRKGVCYDVGRVMMGGNWRPNFDPRIVHRELGIIKNDLHCNAVRICGLDIDRLMTGRRGRPDTRAGGVAFTGDVGQKPG